MDSLYFEDLKLDQRFASEPYQITERGIIDFAREFDVQPFHLDAAAAKDDLDEVRILPGAAKGAEDGVGAAL